MGIRYGKFKLPEKVSLQLTEGNFSRFLIEPFERGHGHTLGNALRRVMLTSLEAPAIVSVKIEGVPHEYMAIEHVVEDMIQVVLNLKGALIRYLQEEEQESFSEPVQLTHVLDVSYEQIQAGGGQHVVTLGEFLGQNVPFEVMNPEMAVFHVTAPITRKISYKVAVGRGYVPSERYVGEKENEEIVLDAIHSPVRLVNYYVENTRVGQDTDYDRLILEVTTDGRITPAESLSFAHQILALHLNVFSDVLNQTLVFDSDGGREDSDRDVMLSKLSLKIDDIELSVRSTNCLSGAEIETIAELVIMPEAEMLKFRNFGKKSLTEIKEKLDNMGLHLGMDLSYLGVTRENVRKMMEEYRLEKQNSVPTA